MVTHAACEIGAIGAVANTYSDIGALITLAGNTGRWLVYQLGGALVTATATPAERYGGHIRIDPDEADDWTPTPTPCEVPTPVFSSGLGTTGQIAYGAPMIMHPVSFQANKGASFNIQGAEAITNAAAAVGIGAIFYGDSVPAHALNPWASPIKHLRRISGSVDATAETSIGTVTVGQNDSRINWIGEVGAVDGTLSADQEMVYRLRLSSDDTPISNFRFPPSAVSPAADATPDAQGMVLPQLWPVDIPIVGGATLDVLADHQIATATTHTVYIGTV